MAASDSRISPTAHYTSYVWVRNRLSHPALASVTGRRLYRTLWPFMEAYRLAGRSNLEMMLLARHKQIDEILAREIEAGRVRQVIEIAAGFSARGWRFMQRYEHLGLSYIEGDLPEQAAEKRRILDGAGLRGRDHEVLALDALVDRGACSLPEIAQELRPDAGTAIITEGLVGYFDRATVVGLWERIARVLRGFPHGIYLSDLNLKGDVRGLRLASAFRLALQAFARGRVHLHFEASTDAEAALEAAGFQTVTLHRPGELVRVVEATSASRSS